MPPGPGAALPDLAALICETGAAPAAAVLAALADLRARGGDLGDILLARGEIGAPILARLRGRLAGMGTVCDPPEPGSVRWGDHAALPAEDAQRLRALPWGRVGPLPLIATDRPEAAATLRAALPHRLRGALLVAVEPDLLDAEVARRHGHALARAAETRAPAETSARSWNARVAACLLCVTVAACAHAAVMRPGPAIAGLVALALAAVVANVALRACALVALLRPAPAAPVRCPRRHDVALPLISVLVPLHDEARIVPALLDRLAALDYPPDRLDVLLVAEADDAATLAALRRERAARGRAFRTVAVPPGRPRTKPRAMNYALGFARGEIVGIYDAEDAPARDQLRKVAARFADAPPEVACLQGLLDFYNARRNWMARCFAIEYAGWFRLVLPGIARLGLVVPLGGTTLFFRRSVLEELGGWDAHNVTEDADLGVRLARAGYRTEVIDTTTLEEANAAPGPWVRQRSRWMKGYAMTWAMHARRPLALLRDLGPWRFAGFHLLFLGAVANALLMPALWSLALIPFGVAHPATGWVPPGAGAWLAAVPMGLALCVYALAWFACRAPHHRGLRAWIPATEAYFALATLAVLKALWEMATSPFSWDKTSHGDHGGAEPGAPGGARAPSGPEAPAAVAPPRRAAPRTPG